MSNPNATQIGGAHYGLIAIQHWDWVVGSLQSRYLEGNFTKYVARHRNKNGLQDLDKAQHYLDKIKDLHSKGKYPPMRQPGSLAQVYASTSQLAVDMRLQYWEAQLLTVCTSWSTMHDLISMDNMLLMLRNQYGAEHPAQLDYVSLTDFPPDATCTIQAGEEPGPEYVNQDR